MFTLVVNLWGRRVSYVLYCESVVYEINWITGLILNVYSDNFVLLSDKELYFKNSMTNFKIIYLRI